MATAASLQRCPECNYSLAGLPAPHRCPECGFEYDEHTRVWTPSNPKAVLYSLIGLAGSTWWLVMPRRFDPTTRLILLASAMIVAFVVVRTVRIYRLGQCAVVCPAGVRYRIHQVAMRLVPWSEIRGVRPQRYDRMCHLQLMNGTAITILGVFRSTADVMSFIEAVEDGMNRHGPTARQEIVADDLAG